MENCKVTYCARSSPETVTPAASSRGKNMVYMITMMKLQSEP